MPMDKTRYPASWPKVSRTIRRLAGNRCEWCHIENGVPLPSGRKGKVVLTVAHLGTPSQMENPVTNTTSMIFDGKIWRHSARHVTYATIWRTTSSMQKKRATAKSMHPCWNQGNYSCSQFHNEPARWAAYCSTTCRAGVNSAYMVEVCRFALKQTCNVKQPVERVAGFAGLFPRNRRKNHRFDLSGEDWTNVQAEMELLMHKTTDVNVYRRHVA